MKTIAKWIRATGEFLQQVEHDEPEPHLVPIIAPNNNVHNVYVHCFENHCTTIIIQSELIYWDDTQTLHKTTTSTFM